MNSRNPTAIHSVSSPWDSGMVNDVLKKAYGERGLAIIPVETGTRFFADEFGSGDGQNAVHAASACVLRAGAGAGPALKWV